MDLDAAALADFFTVFLFFSIYFFTWTAFVLPPSVKLAAC